MFPRSRRMLLRIGVNLGDIIHDGTRTYGDGSMSRRGSSRWRSRADLHFGRRCARRSSASSACLCAIFGEKSLKNIDRPVHIYQIQSPGTRARRDWLGRGCANIAGLLRRSGSPFSSPRVAGVGAWRFWPRETVRPEYTPVIAVLPFNNVSGDKSLDHLGPSLAREVSAMLSTYPMLRIVSPSGLPARSSPGIRRRTGHWQEDTRSKATF